MIRVSRRRRMVGTVCLSLALALCLAAGRSVRAADPPKPDPTDIKINQGVVSAITLGVELYNAGDPTGCYRVYQGALRGLTPLLDARPDLKKIVATGLEQAEFQPTTAQRATALRKVLDSVYEATNPKKSLWARLGGEPAVKAVVHDFVGLAAGDPKVDFLRGGKFQIDAAGVANLEKLLVEMISATTGGPMKYTGRDMKTVHAGMGITKDQFGAIAGDLIAVLKKYQVPQKEIDELVGIIATTQKDIVEDSGADAPPPPPMPPTPSPTTPPTVKTLWERLGGEPAVKAVVHDFVGLAAGDPKVDFLRGGKFQLDAAGVANLEKLLVEMISATTGGPMKYTGRDMKSVHTGMGITKEQFGAIAGDLITVLKKYQVPQKEIDELVGIIATTQKDIVEQP